MIVDNVISITYMVIVNRNMVITYGIRASGAIDFACSIDLVKSTSTQVYFSTPSSPDGQSIVSALVFLIRQGTLLTLSFIHCYTYTY